MKVLFPRVLHLPKQHSVFLFGARNTGKSTLIKQFYDKDTMLFIDLLHKETEARFNRHPDELYQVVMRLPDHISHVVIDEIQKVPSLLDIIHRLTADSNKYFIMTGSSARQLKRGGANLLAGRAFVYHLFPLTHAELQETFDLDKVLQWGSLPDVFFCENDADRAEFLYAYVHTYLKEEIWAEQFIKQLEPFRRFLEVAAQCNGKVINFAKVGKDVGVSDRTIKTYYSILEDTLIGFFLEAYHGSFRKRLTKQPKFYLFDTGVVRALSFLTDVKLTPQTHAYGNAFEHFIILECMRYADYHRLHYRFSYVRTQENVEIDLVVERPGKPLLCIEIKSAQRVNREDIAAFIRLSKDIKNAEAICICRDRFVTKIDHVTVWPWQTAIAEYFTP